MIIIGQKGAESGEISVRSREHGDLGSMSIAEFAERVAKEIRE